MLLLAAPLSDSLPDPMLINHHLSLAMNAQSLFQLIASLLPSINTTFTSNSGEWYEHYRCCVHPSGLCTP